jgi:hypothetical protein
MNSSLEDWLTSEPDERMASEDVSGMSNGELKQILTQTKRTKRMIQKRKRELYILSL